MSEQEKKSGGSAIEGSVMMVEKAGGRLKQPYRPNELQDTDLHQKRPRASIVPSVAEELKYITEDSVSNENEIKKRKECEGVPFYDSQKQSVNKKVASNTERRDHSPESIPLQSIDVDKKKAAIAPSSQPIPDVQSMSDLIAAVKQAATRGDDDSITEEVEEVQTVEVAKKHSELKANPSSVKKKEISWKNNENILGNVGTKKSETYMLSRKASVGPCFKNIAPFAGPSGIAICLPTKSLKCVNQPSGISVNISRKCLAKTKTTANEIDPTECNKINTENKSERVNRDIGFAIFLDNVKDKVCNVQNKIKSFFHS